MPLVLINFFYWLLFSHEKQTGDFLQTYFLKIPSQHFLYKDFHPTFVLRSMHCLYYINSPFYKSLILKVKVAGTTDTKSWIQYPIKKKQKTSILILYKFCLCQRHGGGNFSYAIWALEFPFLKYLFQYNF